MKNYEFASDLIKEEPTKPTPKAISESRLVRLRRLKLENQNDMNEVGTKLLDNAISATKADLNPITDQSNEEGISNVSASDVLAKPTADIKEVATVQLQRLNRLKTELKEDLNSVGEKMLNNAIKTRKRDSGINR